MLKGFKPNISQSITDEGGVSYIMSPSSYLGLYPGVVVCLRGDWVL